MKTFVTLVIASLFFLRTQAMDLSLNPKELREKIDEIATYIQQKIYMLENLTDEQTDKSINNNIIAILQQYPDFRSFHYLKDGVTFTFAELAEYQAEYTDDKQLKNFLNKGFLYFDKLKPKTKELLVKEIIKANFNYNQLLGLRTVNKSFKQLFDSICLEDQEIDNLIFAILINKKEWLNRNYQMVIKFIVKDVFSHYWDEVIYSSSAKDWPITQKDMLLIRRIAEVLNDWEFTDSLWEVEQTEKDFLTHDAKLCSLRPFILFLAIITQDCDLVSKILDKEIDVNDPHYNFYFVSTAVKTGNKELVLLLLDKAKANPVEITKLIYSKLTPLSLSRTNSFTEIEAILKEPGAGIENCLTEIDHLYCDLTPIAQELFLKQLSTFIIRKRPNS